jgi:hypothetical protein
MSFDNEMCIKIKCSEFMLKSNHCNDDTLFLIPDTIHKVHTLYLLVSFIYSKYKDLIFREIYFKEIEKYIEVFKYEAGIHAFSFSDDLYDLCIKLENRLKKRIISTDNFKNIDEYLNDNNAQNVIILDKDSYFTNQYKSYIKEESL